MDVSFRIAYICHGYIYNGVIMRTEKDEQRLVDEQIEKEFRVLEDLAHIQKINKANKKERKYVDIQKEK